MVNKYKFRQIVKYTLLLPTVLVFLLILVYIFIITGINNEYEAEYNNNSEVSLRKFPYPYQAALAISSDIDATKTAEEFVQIQNFLITEDSTVLGKGVGLEIGNSFYCYDPENSFSLFSGSEIDNQVIEKYVALGYLDFLHSFGDKLNFNRSDAKIAIEALNKLDRKLEVWADHSYTIDNINHGIMGGHGAIPDSSGYHTDLTIQYGFKYFWLGRVSSLFVCEAPLNPKTILNVFDTHHPLSSLQTLTKEFIKHVLGILGNSKYAVHRDYSLVKIKTLLDGEKVFEFLRTNSYWEGVNRGENSIGLGYVLSQKNLDHLIDMSGYSIVYTHLGKNPENGPLLGAETIKGLRRLANENRNGKIYVTTSSKMLNYYTNRKYLKYDVDREQNRTHIYINSIFDPLSGQYQNPSLEDLQGITFYVTDPDYTDVYINDILVTSIIKNPADHIHKKSIMFPLIQLKYIE